MSSPESILQKKKGRPDGDEHDQCRDERRQAGEKLMVKIIFRKKLSDQDSGLAGRKWGYTRWGGCVFQSRVAKANESWSGTEHSSFGGAIGFQASKTKWTRLEPFGGKRLR